MTLFEPGRKGGTARMDTHCYVHLHLTSSTGENATFSWHCASAGSTILQGESVLTGSHSSRMSAIARFISGPKRQACRRVLVDLLRKSAQPGGYLFPLRHILRCRTVLQRDGDYPEHFVPRCWLSRPNL